VDTLPDVTGAGPPAAQLAERAVRLRQGPRRTERSEYAGPHPSAPQGGSTNRIGRETHGTNAAVTTYTYEPATGQLSRSLTEAGNLGLMQDLRYTYWDNGAVLQLVIDRGNNPTQFDTYSYDELNRLSNVNGQEYQYDEIGNITLKPDVGLYGYTSAQPHLPVYAGDNTYTYTPRGNLETRSGPNVPAGTQTFEYTSFDLPSRIVSGADEQVTTRLEYDAGQERVMKWTDVSRTFYAGSLYRKRTVDNPTPSTEHRYLVYVGSRQVAEMVRADGESRPHTSYALYSDRIGTVTTLSDGDSIFSRDIDAFGHTDLMEFASTGVMAGFTGHPHDRDSA
jgi:hypothetical protein